MKTFTYDEVIELMSECLNNLNEKIDTDEYVEINKYSLEMDYDNYVFLVDATYDLSDLYDEISIDFRKRLNDLAKFKKSLR
jgi:uncharacterized protein YjbK